MIPRLPFAPEGSTPPGGRRPSPAPGARPRPAAELAESDAKKDAARQRLRLIVATLLIPSICVIDIVTPPDIEFKSLYVLVLIVAGGGIDGRGIWPWTIACLIASVGTFALQVNPAQDVPADARFAIALLTILCTAFLVAQQSAAMALVRRQSRALDVAATAVLIRSMDGEILLWNRAAEELFGWSRREAVGQNADRLLTSRFPEPLEAIHTQLGAKGTWEGEIEYRHLDGSSVTVFSNWTLQDDTRSQAPMIVETDSDARIRRAAELLRLSEQRYRTIFDSLAVAVLEHDFLPVIAAIDQLHADGVTDVRAYLADHPDFICDMRKKVRITGANDTAIRMLCASSKDALCETLDEILPDTDESFEQCLAALAEGQSSLLTETKIRALSGESIPIILMLSFPKECTFDRVTGCFIDIRDRLKMQATIDRTRADLEHALRAASLGELTASIAHEVNQPLSATMSYTQASRRWLNREPPNVAEARTALDDAIMATEHASNVVKRIRKLLGRTDPDRLPVPIDTAIAEAARLVQADAGANRVKLNLDLDTHGAIVLGDKVLLQQVLINLLNNAIQAMEGVSDRERRLLLDTRLSDELVQVRILDTGPGFAEGAAEQAFNAFYTTKPRGMGLGLSICRSTVESHGGAIRIENRADGPGAMVTLELPVAS